MVDDIPMTPPETPEVPTPGEPIPPVDQPPSKPTESEKIAEEERMEPRGAGRKILTGILIFILVFLLLFYALLLWGVVGGNISNPLFATLGLEGPRLKMMLLDFTNWTFGTFTLIFLLAFLVKIFQWAMTPKKVMNRSRHMKRSMVYLFVLCVLVGAWVGLWWLITGASLGTGATTNSTQKSFIHTVPQNTIGLTAPTTVKFRISDELFQLIPQELIRSIHWDLDGDGVDTDASGAAVTKRYLDRGSENGRVMVTANISFFSPAKKMEDTLTTQRELIIANEAVVAEILATPTTGQVPLKTTFSAEKSRDPDGVIVLYEWDLDGDGEFEIRGAGEQEVQKVFSKIGDYTVRLRVTGGNNDSAVAESTVTVEAPDEPLRAEIVSPDSSFEGEVPMEITFDGSQSFTRAGSIIRYEWQFEGEEKPFLGRRVQRRFETPGEYEVILVVENADGLRDQETQLVHVYERREMVIDTLPAAGDDDNIVRGTAPFSVSFDARKSQIPRAIEWRWDFDEDGEIDSFDQRAKFVYSDSGKYNAELIILDSENNEFTQQQKIVVAPQEVEARLEALPVAGVVPLKVDFDGAGSLAPVGQEIVDYIWQFPNEEPIHYSAQISREFDGIGVFPVTLTVMTDQGETSTIEKLITVRQPDLEAVFAADPMAGTAPLTVQFDPRQSTGRIASYLWDFGDGETARDYLPSHTFEIPGEYTVKLKIKDSRGIISERSMVVTVQPEPTEE